METISVKSLLILVLVCQATQPALAQVAPEGKDMSGRMFTFPEESNTAYVTLVPEQKDPLSAVTLCFRFFSDLTRDHGLFSFATPGSANAFLIFKRGNGNFEMHQDDKKLIFQGPRDIPNQWNSLCATWDSTTGIAQLWVNGKPSARKGIRRGSNILGEPIIILGQDQDSYGGKLDAAQSFVGMITDVNMWKSVLSQSEIDLYMSHILINRDDMVINWRSLKYSSHGYILTETQMK